MVEGEEERPKLRWRNSVESDVERAEVNRQVWERKEGDRDGWRRLVERMEQISNVAAPLKGPRGRIK